MNPSSFEHIVRIQFNALMMTVIKCTVKNRNRQFARCSKREVLFCELGQFTRDYTQTVKRAADNKRRYAPGEGCIPPVLLSGVSKGVPPLAHDFACKV